MSFALMPTVLTPASVCVLSVRFSSEWSMFVRSQGAWYMILASARALTSPQFYVCALHSLFLNGVRGILTLAVFLVMPYLSNTHTMYQSKVNH